MAYGAEDVQEQAARVDRLEEAYFAAGRDEKDHPDHGLYTGLLTPIHDC